MHTGNKIIKLFTKAMLLLFILTMLFAMAGCSSDNDNVVSTPELNINWGNCE